MLEFMLVCLLCAEVPDLSLVRQPARFDTLLQTTASGAAESNQKQAPSSPPTGKTVLTAGVVTGVSLLGYGVGLAGELDAGRVAADWAGGFVATLPLAALFATLMPKTVEELDAPITAARGIPVLAVMASFPLAAAGGVAAAEALAGYPVQWRAFWEGAVLGSLVGWGVMYLVGTFIDWVAPGAMEIPWSSFGSEVPWGAFFFAGASVSLMTSAWAAGGYSTQVSPR